VNRHIHDVIAAIAPNDSVERFTALGVHVIQAEAKFTAADQAQANGNSVGWARLMEQGRDLITEAVALAGQRDDAAEGQG
jgi:hypothetical protein